MSLIVAPFAKECVYYRLLSDHDSLLVNFQVLSGGDFEIDFDITAPDGSKVIQTKDKRYADYLLRSFGIGEYSFCFVNSFSPNSITNSKKIEFSIELERDVDYFKKQNEINSVKNEELLSYNALDEIDRNYAKAKKLMDYLRAREWRNMSTVKSTELRVYYLGMFSAILMVALGVGQATIVQLMFSGPRSIV
ncbi:emp24/gp25L/p24 family protein ASCRUDRAFT_6572 [Ascoidea rubescens DSM 1968]|uniref:GOLD domain-containing protein n=1 Tax=Ascoidea rubescens DSM 1968 TaxID=1344418 RepID=A0A1D2VMW1_9ASCO|nr:hypothetical protein ASCRUDRAFT_6572 [Ascoidea rubescens DSM 1968]ODV62952.1 hypothetical protein ASCRUDRAFT_6572 [Ascoidea rubescens DSM 1968]